MPCTPRSGRAFGCWKERPVSGPIWLNWPFAGVMVIFALYHGVRLVTAGQRGRPNGYDIDLAHLLMCTAMAAMLVMTFGAHMVASGRPHRHALHTAIGQGLRLLEGAARVGTHMAELALRGRYGHLRALPVSY